jgi:cyclophilin family peptidyl-prolyl cis-trans isomerase
MNTFLAKRLFSASLYQYGCKTNPRVYFTLSRDGNKLGDLVFEVYANHVPRSAENFLAFVNGSSQLGSYKGTSFTKGFPGIVLQGGRVTECNAAADGSRMVDENLSLRHVRRGTISYANDGENSNGSEFMITLGEAANVLDGYHTVVGQLVEGDEVLAKAESSINRHGSLDHTITIEDCGTK